MGPREAGEHEIPQNLGVSGVFASCRGNSGHVVIVITGAMASGKSTVAQLLAERFDRSVHVRGDIFRRFVVRGRAEPSMAMSDEARSQLLLRYRLAAMTADAYVDAGFVAVWQDVIVGPFLSDAIAMVQSRPVHVVVLDPAPAVITKREEDRDKVGYDNGWDVAHFVETMRATTPRIGLWLDNSAMTPDETTQVVLDDLERALVR
jgi:chloramphenicol 3-O-phosphotransferase